MTVGKIGISFCCWFFIMPYSETLVSTALFSEQIESFCSVHCVSWSDAVEGLKTVSGGQKLTQLSHGIGRKTYRRFNIEGILSVNNSVKECVKIWL